MEVALERAHAELAGKAEVLQVVDFGLGDIGRSGVGMNDTKLVQRVRLVPASLELPRQVESLARVLPRPHRRVLREERH